MSEGGRTPLARSLRATGITFESKDEIKIHFISGFPIANGLYLLNCKLSRAPSPHRSQPRRAVCGEPRRVGRRLAAAASDGPLAFGRPLCVLSYVRSMRAAAGPLEFCKGISGEGT